VRIAIKKTEKAAGPEAVIGARWDQILADGGPENSKEKGEKEAGYRYGRKKKITKILLRVTPWEQRPAAGPTGIGRDRRKENQTKIPAKEAN